MTNIELVKKWLEDNDSVSHAELVANAGDAYATYAAASDAYAVAVAVACGTRAAVHARYDSASHWVKEYEKLENSLTEA